jgi:allantoinase
MIDVHVHFNEPGRTDWEGFTSGSRQMAKGGCTTFIDMPLNSIPSTTTVSALTEKAKLGMKKSLVDFGLWAGLVPENEPEIEGLAEAGAIGFKAFMSATGTSEFSAVDDFTLYEGMKRIAKLNKVLAIHCESNSIIERLTAIKKEKGLVTARDYVESRPVLAELEAVNRALLYAQETGCAVHFVHISNAKTVQLIQAAKERGVNATVETCPHYLLFNVDDFAKKGAVAKCAPPIREEKEREELWKELSSGNIDIIASDHSPCPTPLKTEFEKDLFQAWGGITGGQYTLEAIIDQAHIERNIPLTQVAKWLSSEPAERFGLAPRKGSIAIGADADLAIIDLQQTHLLTQADLAARHPHSPYIGMEFRCRVIKTIQRGQLIYDMESGWIDRKKAEWLKPI